MREPKEPGYTLVCMDGASNLKLLVYKSDTLEFVMAVDTESNQMVVNKGGIVYNNFGQECKWFDSAIAGLAKEYRQNIDAFASVARGATGCYVGKGRKGDKGDRLLDGVIGGAGEDLTMSYAQHRPGVLELFQKIAPDQVAFFNETGAWYGAGITWGIRGLELQTSKELREQAAAFCAQHILMTGYLLGGKHLRAAAVAGGEISYGLCHSGIYNTDTGGLSSFAKSPEMGPFRRLYLQGGKKGYVIAGEMPGDKRRALGVEGRCGVVFGGHDTTLSHIPVLTAYQQALLPAYLRAHKGKTQVIHVEVGSWILAKQLGGRPVKVPKNGHESGLLAQGSVDGQPGLTSLYGGGFDFRELKGRVEVKLGKGSFKPKADQADEELLMQIASAADTFVLPNISSTSKGTGPWTKVKGTIINEEKFFRDSETALILSNLMTAITTATHVNLITKTKEDTPIVLTGGGAKDPYYGRLLATLTGRTVYVMEDKNGKKVIETTGLGAAMMAKAALEGKHPTQVDLKPLGITFHKQEAFTDKTARAIEKYRERFMEHIRTTLGDRPQMLSPETTRKQPARERRRQ
ncbi:MAG: hypothetical protein V1703_03370 [Candidatus Altiarchaeota archaeon]